MNLSRRKGGYQIHNDNYRIFDGFYIPVIPDADYHFDTDHRGCNFLFIDDRQKRYVISFESDLDVYEKCVDFPQYKKSEYSENGRTMHTLLMERDSESERGNYGFFVLNTPYGKLEGQVSIPKLGAWHDTVLPKLIFLMNGLTADHKPIA